MTHLEFCHWLDGYLTLSSNLQLTPTKLIIINNHLKLAETISGPVFGELLQLKHHLDNLDVSSATDYEAIVTLVKKHINYDVGALR